MTTERRFVDFMVEYRAWRVADAQQPIQKLIELTVRDERQEWQRKLKKADILGVLTRATFQMMERPVNDWPPDFNKHVTETAREILTGKPKGQQHGRPHPH